MMLFLRVIAVIFLLSMISIVARFSQVMVLRLVGPSNNSSSKRKLSKAISFVSIFAIFLIMSPFALQATGMNADWLWGLQTFLGRIFANWPVWILISVLLPVVSHLILSFPKHYLHLKRWTGRSPENLKN